MPDARGLLRPTARVVAVAALIGVLAPAAAAAGTSEGARRAAVAGARWLEAAQQPSGAFATGQPADAVAEAAASAVAAGAGPRTAARALAYVEQHGPARAAERAGIAGRTALALISLGRDPRSFGGFDYVDAIASRYDAVTGAYDRGVYANALALLGLLAARARVPAEAFTYVRARACPDGGFAHEEACLSGADVDTTALVVHVFAVAGSDDLREPLARARAWLVAARNDDGGFGAHARDGATNANSTGLVLSAIASLGESPEAAPWRASGSDPLRALLALQNADGSFRYRRDRPAPNLYATVQAIPGALGSPYPIRRASADEVPASVASGAPASRSSLARDAGPRGSGARAVASIGGTADEAAGAPPRRLAGATKGERTGGAAPRPPVMVAGFVLGTAASWLAARALRARRAAA